MDLQNPGQIGHTPWNVFKAPSTCSTAGCHVQNIMYIVTTSFSITCMCSCLHRDTGLCLAANMLLSCRNILAVVGPPNSGKSTLVAALSGRLYKPAKLTGQICISGREKYESFKPTWFSANDVLTSHLTVHQYLVYKGSFLLLQSSRPLLCMRCIADF